MGCKIEEYLGGNWGEKMNFMTSTKKWMLMSWKNWTRKSNMPKQTIWQGVGLEFINWKNSSDIMNYNMHET